MITTAREFGQLVAKARKALGITQRELALAINVGERFIVELEAGKPTCQLGKAITVAVELGIVIGKDARYLENLEEAKAHIAGYCISNDVSEREFQLERGGQWTKGKSCDNFNPIGPFMASADEIADPQNLKMSLSVNGVVRQNGNSNKMIFDCAYVVHYLSQFMTLEAGDLISTGTPPGVALGMKVPVYLKAGDIVELEIEGLGKQRQVCEDAN